MDSTNNIHTSLSVLLHSLLSLPSPFIPSLPPFSFMFLLLPMSSFLFTLLFALISGLFHVVLFASFLWRSPDHSYNIRNYPSNLHVYASFSCYCFTWRRTKLEKLSILSILVQSRNIDKFMLIDNNRRITRTTNLVVIVLTGLSGFVHALEQV